MNRLRPGVLLLVGLLTIMLAACAATQSATESGAQSGADLTGTWTGSTVSGARMITLVLKQTGDNLTGTLMGAGANIDGPVTGTVQGNTVRLRNDRGSTPLLTVNGDQISGTLSAGTAVTLRRTGK
jgi:hypothetical protein